MAQEKLYFVSNYQLDIAWKDLTLEEAKKILDEKLEDDPYNADEWQIDEQKEDLF